MQIQTAHLDIAAVKMLRISRLSVSSSALAKPWKPHKSRNLSNQCHVTTLNLPVK